MSQTIFWAKIRKKTSLPPSKGKTSFAKQPEICAFSQHNLCIKPKPHLAKSGPDRRSEVYQVGFWTSPSRFKPYQTQEMNVFWSDLLLWTVQNDAQKWWNIWKSAKIIENPRSVPYKNPKKITFWARPGNTFRKSMIFTSGALLITSRERFAASAEISWIFIRKLLGSILNPWNERVLKRIASLKQSK